jgi:PAS domain S-box-containing protein
MSDLSNPDEISKMILETAQEGIWVVTAEKKTLYSNSRLAEMLGYTIEEIYSKTLDDFLTEDGRTIADSKIQIRKTGLRNKESYEVPLLRKDGKVLWVMVNTTPIYESGKYIASLSMVSDITKLKEVENELRISDREFKEIASQRKIALNAARLGWWQYNPITDISNWDDGYRRIFGVSDYSRVNKEILEKIIHPDDLSELWTKVENSLNPNDPQDFSAEYRIIRPDGQLRWIEAHGIAFFEGEGSNKHAVNFVGTVQDITDRKNSEEEKQRLSLAVQDERDKFSALVSSITDEVWFADKDGKVNLFNPAVWKEFGSTVGDNQEVEKIALSLEIYQADGTPRPANKAPLLRASGGEVVTKEVEIIRTPGTGKLRHREVSASPVKDKTGQIIGSVAVVRDVSDQVQSEKALRESEQRFRELANAMPQLVWTANPDGVVYYYNERANEFFGFRLDEEGHWQWEMVIHDDDRDSTLQGWKHAAENGISYQMEHRLKMKSGNFRWHLSRAVPAKDAEERIIKWYGTATDIDDLKRAEEEVANSRKKLEIALENGHIGLWDFNVETSQAYLDERSETMLGLRPGSFKGTHDSFEQLIHEEDVGRVREAIDNTLKNDLPYQTIFRTKPMQGKSRYISARALSSKNEKGEIIALSGVNFDITELKEETEKLISKLNTDLLRSNTDLQQFAYVASHDLQEPLRMVASFTQLLQRQYGDKLDEKANEYIDFAVNGSKRMYELINGLLDYSRVQTRTGRIERINMETVLAKVKENLKLIIEETGAIVTNDILPEISADLNQMIQLLQNLIENGIKFSKGTPQIHISANLKNGKYIFSVKDEGIGIERQYFEKIFRIFQKLHSQEEYKGTGIGLALCKRIVERHGGDIWAESEIGKGARFFFTIPE